MQGRRGGGGAVGGDGTCGGVEGSTAAVVELPVAPAPL